MSTEQEQIKSLQAELAAVRHMLDTMVTAVHDQVVANQAAWIEWRHGRGAEAGMQWVENGLFGPGQIPDEDEPYAKEAQAWMDANRAKPFPQCACGRPSNRLWMGHGACSDPCMRAAREAHAADSAEPK